MDYIFNNRTNLLETPANPDGNLIVAFHGGYGSPETFKAVIQLEVLFPDSFILYVDADDTNNNLWRAGYLEVVPEYTNDLSDVGYVTSLIENVIINNPTIDSTKVTLLGHSNGAMMAYRLGVVLEDYGFKGIISIAGAYLAPENFDYRGKVLHIHGNADTIIPTGGTVNYTSLWSLLDLMSDTAESVEVVIYKDGTHNLSNLLTDYPDIVNKIQEFVN